MSGYDLIWRRPAEESRLYPGLMVHDNVQSGSINCAGSRLPLWAFVWPMVTHGWEEAEEGWSPSDYDWTADKMGEFLYCLLEARGEFGRLLLLMADAERWEREHEDLDNPWWKSKQHRKRVADQLRRCLEALESA